MRQVRLTTGRERERVARVTLLSDQTPLAANLMRDYDGTVFARADQRELQRFLLPPESAGAGDDTSSEGSTTSSTPLTFTSNMNCSRGY